MEITLNGIHRDLPERSTVSDLLKVLERDPRLVAVEVNGQLVPRDRHDACRIDSGDEVEVVGLVGGG